MTPEIEKKRRELFDQYCADKGYGSFTTRELLWPCFNSALDAVEIELPKPEEFDGYYNGGFAIRPENVVAAINATGLGLRIKE